MGKDLKGKELGKGISQRKDGRYEARANIQGIKIDLYNTNLAKLKAEFEKTKARALIGDYVQKSPLTFPEWFDLWFDRYKSPQLKSEISRSVYYRKMKSTFYRKFASIKVADIKQINIQTAANELIKEGYVKRSIEEAVGVLRNCLDVAVINKIIAVNPCVAINVGGAQVMAERRVMTQEEQDIFLKEVENKYYYEVYKILLLTGMRIGELTGLQWGDVDFSNKQIHIKRSMQTGYVNGKKIEELGPPKTFNSIRTIPFFGETEECFRSWKEKQAMYRKRCGERWRLKEEYGELVFTSTLGSPVTRYVLIHDLNKVVDEINKKYLTQAITTGCDVKVFEHLHPHAFRHTFATRCFEKGLDAVFVQKIMGHSDYSTTVSYTHVLQDVFKKEVSKAGNFLDTTAL